MKPYVLTFCLLLLPLWQHPSLSQVAKARDADQEDKVKIACVGDSITFGAGIKDRGNNCYPAQLGKFLGPDFSVRNFGVSGATLLKEGDRPYWKTKDYASALSWKPDLIVIKLGTNDTKPKNWEHEAQFASDLKAMITAFRKLETEPEIFLCLPVPAFPERWGIRDSVIREELLPIIRQVAKAEKCKVIDLYSTLEGKKQFFPDRVHPNKDGATLIAQGVYQALTASGVAPGTKPSEETASPKP